jgi:hypothetical protein
MPLFVLLWDLSKVKARLPTLTPG